MQVLQFAPGHEPELANAENISEDTTVLFWLDIERSETDWSLIFQREVPRFIYTKKTQGQQKMSALTRKLLK